MDIEYNYISMKLLAEQTLFYNQIVRRILE